MRFEKVTQMMALKNVVVQLLSQGHKNKLCEKGNFAIAILIGVIAMVIF